MGIGMNSPQLKLRLLRQIGENGHALEWLSGHQSKTVLEMVGDGLVTITKTYQIKITAFGLRRIARTDAMQRKQ
jgi:hypothetical protein